MPQFTILIFPLNYFKTSVLYFIHTRIIFPHVYTGKVPLLQYPISYPEEMSAVNHVSRGDFPLLPPFPLWVSCQVSSF